jgi:hypothetical protein
MQSGTLVRTGKTQSARDGFLRANRAAAALTKEIVLTEAKDRGASSALIISGLRRGRNRHGGRSVVIASRGPSALNEPSDLNRFVSQRGWSPRKDAGDLHSLSVPSA